MESSSTWTRFHTVIVPPDTDLSPTVLLSVAVATKLSPGASVGWNRTLEQIAEPTFPYAVPYWNGPGLPSVRVKVLSCVNGGEPSKSPRLSLPAGPFGSRPVSLAGSSTSSNVQ